MDELIAQIKSSHAWTPPDSAVEDLIRGFEATHDFGLPPDLKAFYRHCGTADLFDGAYRLMSLPELCRASLALAGEESEDWCPASWVVFCDRGDGDYVGIDLATVDGETCHILDCNHEEIGRCEIIARSFSEFLTRALDSSGEAYWLDPAFTGYGVVEHEPPLSYYRRMDASWWDSLGPEVGPELCQTPGCARKRIAFSVNCRRHHYEAIKRRQCPFADDRIEGGPSIE